MNLNIRNVVCAISGGVDSAVAAILLKRQGYQVQGVFMRNWDITDESGYCQADRDKEDAEFVCDKIGIPFTEVNFVKKFWNDVFSYLVQEYSRGYTPNPDIMCNRNIKFDAFLNLAVGKLNADAVATGHYARLRNDQKGVHLLKGMDKNKDQTFFLSQISAQSLTRCLFPIGHLTKDVVKKIACDQGLQNIAMKKESTGICFIGKRKFSTFIEDYIEPKFGHFIDLDSGNIVGEHKGVHCWTIGQRCLLPGKPNAYYVAERNLETQEILVVPSTNHSALYHKTFVVKSPHWISEAPSELARNTGTFQCDFRFQHRQPLIKCLLYKSDNDYVHVLLEKPLKAVTPGQFAVFYKAEECLGSSKILYRGPSSYIISKVTNTVKASCCRYICKS